MGEALLPLAVGGMITGTAMSFIGQRQEGKEAQKIANARALIDLDNAKMAEENARIARERANEAALVQAEQGRRFKNTQKSIFAAGNIKLNIGTPLVVEAQTNAAIAKDIGFTLEEGETEANFYNRQAGAFRASADIERRMGKSARKNANWSSWASLMQGGGSLAMLGYSAMPKKMPTTASPSMYKSANSANLWLNEP
ncbi:MAG: hypothetical protein PHG53_09560 [Phycisphaerae bacterium]|nr:hypothetical protein [Phycisphaerae bacterium]